jgi:hypothetical protein
MDTNNHEKILSYDELKRKVLQQHHPREKEERLAAIKEGNTKLNRHERRKLNARLRKDTPDE